MANETTQAQAGAASVASPTEAVELLRSLGFVFVNASMYSLDHNVTRQALIHTFAAVRAFLERHGYIDLAVTDAGFAVTGTPVSERPAGTQLLRTRMTDAGTDNVAFQPGVTLEELTALFDLLMRPLPPAPARPSLQERLEAAQVSGITSAKYIYRRISEHEVVVSKRSVEVGADGRLTETSFAHLAAYLQGRPEDVPIGPLCDAAAKSEQLTELIRQAAAAAAADVPPAAAMATSLRLACAGMLQNDSNRTQKGRQGVKRAILQIERQLAEDLAADPDGSAGRELLHATVEDLVEDLEVEALVARYAKQYGQVAASEARLLRQIKRAIEKPDEIDSLHSKMVEAGVDFDAWEALLAKAGADRLAPLVPTEHDPERLAALVGRLVAMFSEQQAPEGESVKPVVSEVRRQVAESTATTQSKIHSLAGRDLPQPKLLEVLAEIGQELAQPLTVVNGTIDMILLKHVGPISETQNELLRLAAESGERLRGLIERLVQVAGYPEGLTPDRELLKMPPAS